MLGERLTLRIRDRTNVRSDAYGGSPERRLRFLRETLAAVREATLDTVGASTVAGSSTI